MGAGGLDPRGAGAAFDAKAAVSSDGGAALETRPGLGSAATAAKAGAGFGEVIAAGAMPIAADKQRGAASLAETGDGPVHGPAVGAGFWGGHGLAWGSFPRFRAA